MNTESSLIVAIIVLAATSCGLAFYVVSLLRDIIRHQAETIELLAMGPGDDDDEDDPELRDLIPPLPRQVNPIPTTRRDQ